MRMLRRTKKGKKVCVAFTAKGTKPLYAELREPLPDTISMKSLRELPTTPFPIGDEIMLRERVYDLDKVTDNFVRRT